MGLHMETKYFSPILAGTLGIIITINTTATASLPPATKPVVDLSLETSKSQFKVRRFYHPLYKGYFGKGWCSDLDLKLELLSERTLALKACRLLNPVLFSFKNKSLSEEVKSAEQPALALKKAGNIWLLKNKGVSIAQFRADGKPMAIRSSHDGETSSSEWLHFSYTSEGTLSDIGFLETERPLRSMANLQVSTAHVLLNESGVIQEIQTPLDSYKYVYKNKNLIRVLNRQVERSKN